MLPSLLRQFYFIFKAQEDKSKKRFPFPASPLLPSSTLAVRYFKPDWFPQSCCCLLPPPVFTASIFSSLFFDARIILTGGDVSTVCSSRTEVSLQPISSNIASASRQQTTTCCEEWGGEDCSVWWSWLGSTWYWRPAVWPAVSGGPPPCHCLTPVWHSQGNIMLYTAWPRMQGHHRAGVCLMRPRLSKSWGTVWQCFGQVELRLPGRGRIYHQKSPANRDKTGPGSDLVQRDVKHIFSCESNYRNYSQSVCL